MTKDPTLESLDELVRLIADKASDLAVLAGLNRVIEEHDWDTQNESEYYDHQMVKDARQDWHEGEEYDCPITEKENV